MREGTDGESIICNCKMSTNSQWRHQDREGVILRNENWFKIFPSLTHAITFWKRKIYCWFVCVSNMNVVYKSAWSQHKYIELESIVEREDGVYNLFIYMSINLWIDIPYASLVHFSLRKGMIFALFILNRVMFSSWVFSLAFSFVQPLGNLI